MQIVSKGRMALIAVAGIFIAGILPPSPANAQVVPSHHHRHRYLHHHYRHVYQKVSYNPAPRQSDFGPTAPGVSSAMIDVRTGALLATDGADIPRYPASLTKLMTLDLAFQALASGRLNLDTQIPISAAAADVEPVKLGLRPGDTISVGNAIMAMTTMSANDAATALGQYLGGGSLTRCADMMTLRAHALGMAQTQFTNPSGLPNPYQVTTARDMALLARDIVLEYPQFQYFFEIKSFNFRGRSIYSNNGMLALYPGTTGMKTGYTDLARHNLVTSVDRGGRMLVGVVLHEPSWGVAYTQMASMLNTGFYGHEVDGSQSKVAQNQPKQPIARVERVASRTDESVEELPNSINHPHVSGGQWIVRLGAFYYKQDARFAALKAHRLHGYGIAQIQHVERHGQALWVAQLTGLTYSGAKDTCREMRDHDGLCAVQHQGEDHLAMRTLSDDET